MRGRRPVGVGVVAWSLAAGCAEPAEPLEAEPVEARIAVEPVEGARICAGTEAWIDDEIARVQQQLGFGPAFELPVLLGEAAVAEHCTEPLDDQIVLGCTVGDEATTAVIARPSVLGHELVHGLRRQHGLRTRAMFEEGFAEVVGGSHAYPRTLLVNPRALPDSHQPEAMVQMSAGNFRHSGRYLAASHFLAFVAAEHGVETLAEFMRQGIDDSAEEALTRYEVHLGAPLAEHAQAWRDGGLQVQGQGDPCADGIVSPEPGADAVLRATVDCEQPHTFGLVDVGSDEGPWTRRCVALTDGSYRLTLTGGSGRMDMERLPGTCPTGDFDGGTASKSLEVGQSVLGHMQTCTWVVTFHAPAGGRESFELVLAHYVRRY